MVVGSFATRWLIELFGKKKEKTIVSWFFPIDQPLLFEWFSFPLFSFNYSSLRRRESLLVNWYQWSIFIEREEKQTKNFSSIDNNICSLMYNAMKMSLTCSNDSHLFMPVKEFSRLFFLLVISWIRRSERERERERARRIKKNKNAFFLLHSFTRCLSFLSVSVGNRHVC